MPASAKLEEIDDASAYNRYASAAVDLSNAHVSESGLLTSEWLAGLLAAKYPSRWNRVELLASPPIRQLLSSNTLSLFASFHHHLLLMASSRSLGARH